MGTNTLPTRRDPSVISGSWFNVFREALIAHLVPRNAAGSPEANAGNLGTETAPFHSMNVSSGDVWAGTLMHHYDYASSLSTPEGAMLCDGRVINKTNYDAEHGAGHWDLYVGTSPLTGKYLPDFTDTYAVGAVGPSANGAAAIPKKGNVNHTVNLSHNHGGSVSTGPEDGFFTSFEKVGPGNESIRAGHTHTAPVAAAGAAAQVVKPATIPAKTYMRII